MRPVNKIPILVLVVLLSSRAHTFAQPPPDSIQLKTTKGKFVNYAAVRAPLMLVCFWSVNSEASIDELNALNTQYAKYKKPQPFLLLAICIDEGTLLNRMRPTAIQNDWTFDTYADIDGGLQQLLHFTQAPQAIIVNKEQVVYQQSGFSSGSENYLLSKLQALAAEKGR